MLRPSEKNSEKTHKLIYEIFLKNIDDPHGYELIYGYFLHNGYFYDKMISYIIGFNEKKQAIAIIPINSDGVISSSIIRAYVKDIIAMKFISEDELFIHIDEPKCKLNVIVQAFTSAIYLNSNIYPIIQDAVINKLANFIKINFQRYAL